MRRDDLSIGIDSCQEKLNTPVEVVLDPQIMFEGPADREFRNRILYIVVFNGLTKMRDRVSFFRHAREGGHPVYSVPNFLDSCLRRNDGLYRNKLRHCSTKIYLTFPFSVLCLLTSVICLLFSVFCLLTSVICIYSMYSFCPGNILVPG